MSKILYLPKNKKSFPNLPKKRIFFIGYRYVGPMFCQDVQNLYLKRKGIKNGMRYWAIITYAKYDEYCSREYSIELDECKEDGVIEMINNLDIEYFPSIYDLRNMGWRGQIHNKETVLDYLTNDVSCNDKRKIIDFGKYEY